MEFDLGHLTAHVSLESSGIRTGMAQVQKAVDDTNRTITKFAAGMNNVMRAVVGYVSIRQAVRVLSDWKNAARDAAESENLFVVSMGQSAEAARAWSHELGSALGLNEVALRRQVGTLNVMLHSMGLGEQAAFDMSKGLVQLTQDMSSFYNVPVETMFQKIQSGLSGEIEPLRRLGVMLDETTTRQYAVKQGWIKEGQELSNLGKVYSRYGSLVEQTSKSQGDLARTADSAANMERRVTAQFEAVKIELGNALLPAWQRAMLGISTYLQSNLEDVKAWANGVVATLGWVGKQFLRYQDWIVGSHFSELIQQTVNERLPLEQTTWQRFQQLHPEGQNAFQYEWQGGLYSGGMKAVQNQALADWQRIHDQVLAEREALKRQLEQENADLLNSNVQVPTLPKINANYDTTPPTVQPPTTGLTTATDSVAKDTERIFHANARLAGSLRDVTASYTTQIALLDEQKKQYEAIGADAELITRWYAEQTEEIKIQTLKYGDSLIGGFQAAGMQLKREMKTWGEKAYEVGMSISDAFGNALTDIMEDTRNWKESIKKMLLEINREILRIMVIDPLKKQATNLLISLGTSIANAFRPGGGGNYYGSGNVTTPGGGGGFTYPGGEIAPQALGNVFARGRVVPFAAGDIFDRPVLFPMADGNIGELGEAGPEGVLPLKRDRSGRLGVISDTGNKAMLAKLDELIYLTKRQKIVQPVVIDRREDLASIVRKDNLRRTGLLGQRAR